MPLLAAIKNRVFTSLGKTVKLVVYVPPETPPGEPIYLAGACPELGEWSPSGLRLKQVDHHVWEGRLPLTTAEQPLEFKVTRGSWETVEVAAHGGDAANTWVEPGELSDGVVRHRVERWFDS